MRNLLVKIELPYHSPNYTLIKRPRRIFYAHKMPVQWIIKRLIAGLVHWLFQETCPLNVKSHKRIP